jgi:hypothetical protein
MSEPQLYIFHFCCPLCGAQPGSQSLRIYLEGWANSKHDRLRNLFANFGGALQQVCNGQSRWKTRKFVKVAAQVLSEVACLPEFLRADPEFTLALTEDQSLVFSRHCPVCRSGAGFRTLGKYFTIWSEACRVQTANLLYETGLVLWGSVRGLPSWASGDVLSAVNMLRQKIVRSYRDMGAMECQQCGRPVTCLFGGTKNEKDGFCRHCADMGGGFWPGLRIQIDEELSIIQQIPDPQAPARNSRDVMPPDFLQ